jgi:hypothetical protein
MGGSLLGMGLYSHGLILDPVRGHRGLGGPHSTLSLQIHILSVLLAFKYLHNEDAWANKFLRL